jgi:peptidoglycan hydrolase-like protein with peptidoglycan-binding domain
MPVAPPGLGERITSGIETTEPAYPVSPPAPGAAVAPQLLSADQIRQLQQGLVAQGYALRVDGRWGPETAGAVQSYQQRQNIAVTPGSVDAQTLAMLGMSAAPGVSLRRGGQPVARRGVAGAPIPGSGIGPQASPAGQPGAARDIGAGFGGVTPGGASFGGPMSLPSSPPSTPGLDAPGNNGLHPESSIGIPDVTRPAGFRR